MAASNVYDAANDRDYHTPYPATHPYAYESPYYYATGDATHDSGAVRQYYGDAAAGMSYGPEYAAHPADEWTKNPQSAGPTQPYPSFYESGEVSPASDSSSNGTYDSPPHSHKASLLEDGAGYHSGRYYGSYDAGTVPYAATSEQYGYQTHSPEHAHADMQQAYYEHQQAYSSSHPYYGASPSDNHSQAARASGSAPVRRSPSPMGHLPYEDVQTYMPRGYCSSAPQQFMYDAQQHHHAPVEQPQPLYPPHPYSSLQQQQQQHYPTPIAIPASRSPAPVEDTPKKPLTLACFFCRKRKIACGSPPPGKKDRTCNQCARRNLRCEYPVNSRRGTRQREVEAQGYAAPAGYGHNPS